MNIVTTILIQVFPHRCQEMSKEFKLPTSNNIVYTSAPLHRKHQRQPFSIRTNFMYNSSSIHNVRVM